MYPWSEFIVLVLLGLVGVVAVMPYAFVVQKDVLARAPLSRPMLRLVSILQSGILVVLAVGVGLLLAREIGLGAPLIESLLAGTSPSLGFVPLAILLGLAAGAVIVLLDQPFRPHLPEAFQTDSTHGTATWQRFLASFYGGVTEELLMRLFLLSFFAWLLGHLWHTPEGTPTVAVFWLANVLAALLFGVGHLPAARAIAPLTPALVARTLLLNGLGALVFGYLFWQHGLEAAMLAHFCADIVLHLIAPGLPLPDRR